MAIFNPSLTLGGAIHCVVPRKRKWPLRWAATRKAAPHVGFVTISFPHILLKEVSKLPYVAQQTEQLGVGWTGFKTTCGRAAELIQGGPLKKWGEAIPRIPLTREGLEDSIINTAGGGVGGKRDFACAHPGRIARSLPRRPPLTGGPAESSA